MKIGEVIAILNDSYLLVKSEDSQSLSRGDELIVYGEFEIKGSTQGAFPKIVTYPKGRINVIAHQEGRIYLAATVKTKRELKTIEATPFAGAFKNLFGPTEEIMVPVQIEDKAILNKNESMDVEFNLIVNVGDKITKESYL